MINASLRPEIIIIKRIGLLFLIVLTLCNTSCSKNQSIDNPKSIVAIEKTVDSQPSIGLLNDLYVGCNGDVETLSRILNVTPSTIKRIRKGTTVPTEQLEDRIREISIVYIQNDKKVSKLRAIADPEYGWYESVLYFPVHHPWIFWIGNIFLIFLIACGDEAAGIGVTVVFLEIILGLIAWIASLICSPDLVTDSYIDSINPKVEVSKNVQQSKKSEQKKELEEVEINEQVNDIESVNQAEEEKKVEEVL